jgi:hypothetical protein
VQQVDYSGKANKRTLDAAKARIIAIVGLREFLAAKFGAIEKGKRRSMNM